jgi:hypothetical protein
MRLRIADVRGAVVAEYSTSVQQGRGAISLAEALATASNVSAGAYCYQLLFTDASSILVSRGMMMLIGR